MRRLAAVREFRLASTAASTRVLAEQPWRFFSMRQTGANYLLVPEVSSERRRYVPVGFMDASVIAANTASIVPNATLYHFGVVTSNVHNAWMRTVAGRLEMRYRYSGAIVYNNFPWPDGSRRAAERAKPQSQPDGLCDSASSAPLRDSLRKFFRRETGTTLRAWRAAHGPTR